MGDFKAARGVWKTPESSHDGGALNNRSHAKQLNSQPQMDVLWTKTVFGWACQVKNWQSYDLLMMGDFKATRGAWTTPKSSHDSGASNNRTNAKQSYAQHPIGVLWTKTVFGWTCELRNWRIYDLLVSRPPQLHPILPTTTAPRITAPRPNPLRHHFGLISPGPQQSFDELVSFEIDEDMRYWW